MSNQLRLVTVGLKSNLSANELEVFKSGLEKTLSTQVQKCNDLKNTLKTKQEVSTSVLSRRLG
ncbi:MAG: hypothetical protein P4M12_10915 [Gammaproteobacteria bacterium]|nr:hypothetical protein [Gammaproteobacteria bacterium]